MAIKSKDAIYLVHTNPSRSSPHCTLEDGSVVLCSFRHMVDATAVAAGKGALKVVRRSELSPEEKRRVDEAFRAPNRV